MQGWSTRERGKKRFALVSKCRLQGNFRAKKRKVAPIVNNRHKKTTSAYVGRASKGDGKRGDSGEVSRREREFK